MARHYLPNIRTSTHLLSSIRRSRQQQMGEAMTNIVPHQGALGRVEDDDSHVPSYVIEIVVASAAEEEDLLLDLTTRTHDLLYSRQDYDFVSRLFAILDTDSLQLVHRHDMREFVLNRCPVFAKRDEDLARLGEGTASVGQSQTFDEIWNAVVACSKNNGIQGEEPTCLGVEGWMVFCRFIALAQYLEAKRRFSARHLQQTMRHRNAPRGSEVVVVDVPPPEPPVPITPDGLAAYEQKSGRALPVPELDLDHSLLAAHDSFSHPRAHERQHGPGYVKISLFGGSKGNALLSQPSAPSKLEFALTYSRPPSSEEEEVVVRRCMSDMKWLNDTFRSHKVLGGTLCGRILPPFPASSSASIGILSSHFAAEDSTFSTATIKSTTGGAIHVATTGVGRIRDAAKSLSGALGSYLTSSPIETSGVATDQPGDDTPVSVPGARTPSTVKKPPKKMRNLSLHFYNPNSSIGRARQLERYLNYLLEHPALSSSFPLNTILTASQSGLEAARQILEDCNRVSMELREQTPHVGDGKASYTPNFAWVRTAAQAAMALKVHGMLETTGMKSASARLQHASLPDFGTSPKSPGWDDAEVYTGRRRSDPGDENSTARGCSNFEEGVVNDDGFDLLPLPVPAPERRILTVGNDAFAPSSDLSGEERFHYGVGSLEGRYTIHEEENECAFLGDISVDENIDKLREVIGSVDNTISRCLTSCDGIGKSHRERQNLHLNFVRGLDSWPEMRGRFISQRSLMKGGAGIDQSRDLYEESDLALIDDLSWQTSLATSAVAAAEDVREAVRVARTASNARAAASSAAMSAQAVCERGEFGTLDEARAAQTRASIAQSHAIHAAVVEYEAKTVKRRSTLALAHDVKIWNIHRKREMIRSCISFARSQHEATRRSVDAWSSLRDGFIGTPVNPSVVERRHLSASSDVSAWPSHLAVDSEPLVEPGEVSATIYDNPSSSTSQDAPTIVAVEHSVLTKDLLSESVASDNPESTEADEPETILPFAGSNQIPEEEVEDLLDFPEEDAAGSSTDQKNPEANSDDKMSESMQSLVEGLMNWGGGFDAEEDHFALPMGMATSIILEENNVYGKS